MDNKQLEEMLKQAAAKLGTTTEGLKQMVESGALQQSLNDSIDGPSKQLKQVLSDPETAKKLLSSPQAQELLRLLQQKNK